MGNYLWFSRVGLFFYYLRSLIGWLPIFIGIQLRFYFYLYGLEYQYFFSILSKVFYVGMLIGLNILGRGYFFFIFGILNYLLIRGIYFFSFSLLRQYFLSLLTCALYVLVLHEFSLFSLVIGFPVSLIFYIKFSSLFLRCYFISCLFLVPIVLSLQLGNLPFFEELLVSLILLLIFI